MHLLFRHFNFSNFKCLIHACATYNTPKTQKKHVFPPYDPFKFIFKDVPAHLGKTWSVCSFHFSEDSFVNKAQVDAGFVERLKLKSNLMYAPRWDCGSFYQVHVELLDQKKKPIRTFEPDPVYFEQWNDQQWCQMTHVFKDYGRGVRFIRFTHGGQDTQYWAGWYGIRVINSSVEICPSAER